MQPTFSIVAIELYERPVRLRLPFRFGAATVTEAPQAFVRARIGLAGGARNGQATGAAAELMIPKWFDKSLQRSNADNIADLRAALSAAAAAYTSQRRPATAFGHAAEHYRAILDAGAAAGLNPLTASYGGALIDRALLDALCRSLDVSFAEVIRANLLGIDARLTPELAGFDLDRFLGSLSARSAIAARHTVGILDPIDAGDDSTRPNDGQPATLGEVIAAYGNRYFKIKLGGNAEADVTRLTRIASVLDQLPWYAVTLDGNEQFETVAAVDDFWRRVGATRALDRLAAVTLYLEQPLPRTVTLGTDVSLLDSSLPVLIDESDATLDAFPSARRCGYRGVSSKSCKGIYKSLLNAARCAQANAVPGPRAFLSGEDLTAQAGLAVQQDLALVGLLGLTHVERNGHHYVDGFAGQGAGPAEQKAFLAAHPDLYRDDGGNVRLAIRNGTIALRSLDQHGFGSGAEPDWTSLAPLSVPPVASSLAR
ncbi:MAG TPA: mandelate racemase [Casimicrobiaceae bacterium]|nr:mandelate racemase [Casimicrobiaceae bacterium]